jgi:hypothetical protein
MERDHPLRMPATVQHSIAVLGNEPYHRLPALNSNTSRLLSDETVSTVPSPLDSLLDSTGTYGDETGGSNSEKGTKCQSSHRFAPHFSSVFGRRG